jgi:RNA recognition motif-containing protein
MNIYVSNLFYNVTEKDLILAFDAFGQIESAHVIKDKLTGESKGFGFVQMISDKEAQAAIDGMNGKDLNGRAMNVAKARPRSVNHRRNGERDSFNHTDKYRE